MKRIILIIAILFTCSSLKSQVLTFPPDSIKLTQDNRLIVVTFDTICYSHPVYIKPSITVSTIVIEPPKSFSMQLAIPIDQYKQNSSQWGDLKARIKEIPHLKVKVIALTVIGTWMYCFQDDLQAWSRKHDKASHLFLSYGMSKFFGWKFALGFMLSIEATQSDIFGTAGRYEDTIEDLFVDGCGIFFSLKF